MLKKIQNELAKNGEVFLRTKVRTGAAKNAIKDIMADETIKIDIAAQPVKGRANVELIKFLAREFNANADNIKIISGAAEHTKLVRIKK